MLSFVTEIKTTKNIDTEMKNSFFKYLGLILILIGAIALVVASVSGSLQNENWYIGGSMGMIVVGLIVYIILNKKITA